VRQDGRTPLYIALIRGHAEAVKALLAAGADVEAKTMVSMLQGRRDAHARTAAHLEAR
jgi:ankyrin repeat protein